MFNLKTRHQPRPPLLNKEKVGFSLSRVEGMRWSCWF